MCSEFATVDLSQMGTCKPLSISDIVEAKRELEKQVRPVPIFSVVVIEEKHLRCFIKETKYCPEEISPTAIYGMSVFTYKTGKEYLELIDKLNRLNKTIIDVRIS